MTGDIRSELFARYHQTHVEFVDQDEFKRLDWFRRYFRRHYLPHIDDLPRTARVLEIGCNKGYLLNVLHENGFMNLTGIDLSSDDLKYADRFQTGAELLCVDAFEFLEEKLGAYDFVLMKAVLEHIPKNSIHQLLRLIKKSLASDARLVVDVPNMDWFFASHERYMDFTHEVGFTKESLSQVLRLEFDKVSVHPCDNAVGKRRTVRLKKVFAQYLLGKLLTWADPEGGGNPIWCRSLLAVAKT